MNHRVSRTIRSKRLSRFLWVVLILQVSIATALAQPPISNHKADAPEPIPPWLRLLQEPDATRATELNKAIEEALKADRWDEAIARKETLLTLRSRVQGPGHYQTVNEEWGLKAFRRVAAMPRTDRDAYQSANIKHQQALKLYNQGKYDEAQPLYEESLKIHQRLLSDDHPFTAQLYNELAANLDSQAKFDRAETLYRKALDICERLLTGDHPGIASKCNNLAYNLNARGKYKEAQPLYEKALKMHRRLFSDNNQETALSYNNVASNLDAQGQFAEAQPYYEKALEILRNLLMDKHPYTAGTYNNLASNLEHQGKLIEAQLYYQKVLEILLNLPQNTLDPSWIAGVYNNLAANLSKQRKYDEAQPWFEKALELNRRQFGEDHPQTAYNYGNAGTNLSFLGKYPQAKLYLEKALEIRRRRLTDDHPDTANTLMNLGGHYNRQGDYAKGQELFEKALKLDRGRFGDDHPDVALLFINLGLNLVSQGKYREAEGYWLSGVKSLDATRLRTAFSGQERAGAIKSPRAALAAIQARLGRPAEAWQSFEEDLGRGLLDDLAARKDQRLKPDVLERLRSLTDQLERLDRLMETNPKGLDQKERAKRYEELKHKRERANIALGELQVSLLQKYGAIAGRVAGLGEVQAALPADTALVAWVDMLPAGPKAADPDGEHWGIVVRSQGVPAWIPIKGTGPNGHWSNDDIGLTNRVRTLLQEPTDGKRTDLLPLLDRLRTQRLAPMAKALDATDAPLPKARRLIVLPSNAMAGIPVEVLLADDDTRTVSYAPSATLFKYLRDQPAPDRNAGLLALGNPVYNQTNQANNSEPHPNGLLVKASRNPRQARSPTRSDKEEFTPLPWSRVEVESIAKLFQEKARPQEVFLDSKASEPTLDNLARSNKLREFSVIHLATHAVINEGIPALSAVILSQDGLPDPLDQMLNDKPVFNGRLSVREIRRGWSLNADLVTLSACKTALGRVADGDGFVGFTQALLLSGARSVCLSLWPVDDRATALLMIRFYQNWLGYRPGMERMPKAEALREAKAWLRNLSREEVESEWTLISRGGVKSGKVVQNPSPHPFADPLYWAGFILTGDPD